MPISTAISSIGHRCRSSAGRLGAPPLRAVRALIVALTILATACIFASPQLTGALQLDRDRLASGELWRVLTGHVTHWTAEHLAFDVLAFALLLWLCLERTVLRTLATLGAAAVVIPITVLIAHPDMQFYRGLSGLDSALFVLLGALLLREGIQEQRRGLTLIAALALVAFAAKSAFEIATGDAVFAASGGFVPVPIAHVAGALVGLIAGLLFADVPFRRRGLLASGGWRG